MSGWSHDLCRPSVPPGRVRSRCQHRRVPDRGCGGRGRPRPQRLGHLLRRARPDRRRQQRRRGVRPLPPLPRGRRPDARAGARRLPVLDRVAADPPGRLRPGEPGGPRLLRPARRRAARGRGRADGDAVPLGPPAGARGRGRLALPGDRRAVRRVRRDGRRATGGPGRPLDPGERAQRRDDARLRDRRARPRPADDVRRAARRPPPAARPRPGGRCAAGGRRHERRARPTTTCRCGRRRTPRRTGRPRTSTTRCGTGCSPTRCCSAATPRASPT